MLGTQPTPPSDRTILRSGNRIGMPENSQSAAENMAFTWNSSSTVYIGESLEGCGVCDDEPTWRFRTVPVSSQARRNGSQCAVWIDGRPRASGFSEKLTEVKPSSALRSEESRGGKEGVRTWRSRWAAAH